MGIISYLDSIKREYSHIEYSKSWKTLYSNLRTESELLFKTIELNEAKHSRNKTRNRYHDVLPYDYSRVPVVGIGDNDYINASYVQFGNNKQLRRYILTQGPLSNTISHFWRMIWNEQSTCIVMLNKIVERDTVKCAQYFPTESSNSMCYEFDDLSLCLSLIESIDNVEYVKRVFSLVDKFTNENRRIIHYHYLSWPDFGVPLNPVSLLEYLWDIRASGGLDDCSRPCVVHCSAGIGRSGTFVLIDTALREIVDEKKDTSDFSLQEILFSLRKQRMGLIQSPEQLKFAYFAIIVGAESLLDSNRSPDAIRWDDDDGADESDLEEDSTSEMCTDSDYNNRCEIMESNAALDQAAAAVRSRRGLPISEKLHDCAVIEPSNQSNDRSEIRSTETTNVAEDCRQSREIRCNRTREKIAEIRDNMRRQDLERNRIINRLGLTRLINTLSDRATLSVVVLSVLVGVLSLIGGLVVYKYWR